MGLVRHWCVAVPGAGRLRIGGAFRSRPVTCWPSCSPSSPAAAYGAGPEAEAVVLGIRGPRVLAALLVGAALSMSGAAYQSVFRNPLVAPDLLGVSSGAALGARSPASGWAWGLGHPGLAFAGGLVAVALVYARSPFVPPARTAAGAGAFRHRAWVVDGRADRADEISRRPYNQLPAMSYWLLGGLSGVTPADIGGAAGGRGRHRRVVAAALAHQRAGHGDEDARALGVDTRRVRLAAIAAATLASAAAVAISGVIGWWAGGAAPGAAGDRSGQHAPATGIAHRRRRFPAAGGYAGAQRGQRRTASGRAHGACRHPFSGCWLRGAAGNESRLATTSPMATGARRIGRASLAVAKGEVVCLLGPNGGGKTTLFKTLLGLIPALGGRVLLGGDDLAKLPRAEVARRIARVPQVAQGYFPFSVREVVGMARAARRRLRCAVETRPRVADEAIERVGIAHPADADFTRISGASASSR